METKTHNQDQEAERLSRNQEIATTIRDQIGRRALFMMGAKNIFAINNGLQFQFQGCQDWNSLRIVLDYNTDTYTLTFFKIGRAPLFEVKNEKSLENVYVGDLHRFIKDQTGLALSL